MKQAKIPSWVRFLAMIKPFIFCRECVANKGHSVTNTQMLWRWVRGRCVLCDINWY